MTNANKHDRGAGPYSKSTGFKDPIRAGDKGDLPAGKGSRQLDVENLHADGRPAPLPRKGAK